MWGKLDGRVDVVWMGFGEWSTGEVAMGKVRCSAKSEETVLAGL